MDRVVMAESANRPNSHIMERWSPSISALLTCYNLDAHVYEGTKDILAWDGRVFLLCFPPGVTEAIQHIDAGHDSSIRCTIGRLSDNWLMESDNLEVCERGLTASEGMILINTFVAAEND